MSRTTFLVWVTIPLIVSCKGREPALCLDQPFVPLACGKTASGTQWTDYQGKDLRFEHHFQGGSMSVPARSVAAFDLTVPDRRWVSLYATVEGSKPLITTLVMDGTCGLESCLALGEGEEGTVHTAFMSEPNLAYVFAVNVRGTPDAYAVRVLCEEPEICDNAIDDNGN